MKLHIQIVNINNLNYTRNLVDDLMKQSERFWLTIIDQGSTEEGTKEYLDSVKDRFDIIRNERNVNLTTLWNNFYLLSIEPYLCFLNNDVRVPSNFVRDTIQIFEKDSSVGCVVHATNHPDYKESSILEYVFMETPFVQGWDFSIRRKAYTMIPEELDTFGGDDYLFHNLYDEGWKVAIALSSPIIHYKAKSRKYFTGDRTRVTLNLKKYGYTRWPYRNPYSRPFPKEI